MTTDHIVIGTNGAFSKTYDKLPKAIIMSSNVNSGVKAQGTVIIDNGTVYSTCGVNTTQGNAAWSASLSGTTISFPQIASTMTGQTVTLVEIY